MTPSRGSRCWNGGSSDRFHGWHLEKHQLAAQGEIILRKTKTTINKRKTSFQSKNMVALNKKCFSSAERQAAQKHRQLGQIRNNKNILKVLCQNQVHFARYNFEKWSKIICRNKIVHFESESNSCNIA